jgi:hypothetical protein
LISVWYGMPLSSASVLKYAMVVSSTRIVTDRFKRFACGLERLLVRSYSLLLREASSHRRRVRLWSPSRRDNPNRVRCGTIRVHYGQDSSRGAQSQENEPDLFVGMVRMSTRARSSRKTLCAFSNVTLCFRRLALPFSASYSNRIPCTILHMYGSCSYAQAGRFSAGRVLSILERGEQWIGRSARRRSRTGARRGVHVALLPAPRA